MPPNKPDGVQTNKLPASRITPLDQFLALRGALKDDEEFDSAIEFLNKAWQEWAVPDSG